MSTCIIKSFSLRVGLGFQSSAAEWIRTTTGRGLNALTLPLVYGGMGAEAGVAPA